MAGYDMSSGMGSASSGGSGYSQGLGMGSSGGGDSQMPWTDIVQGSVTQSVGFGEMLWGAMKQERAKKAAPALIDPRQQSLLNALIRKRAALESGRAYAPQQAALKQSGTTAMNRAGSYSSSMGEYIGSMNAINRGTQRGLNQLYGQMTSESTQVTSMMDSLIQRMSQREYQIKATEQARLNMEAASLMSSGIGNAQAGGVQAGGGIMDMWSMGG